MFAPKDFSSLNVASISSANTPPANLKAECIPIVSLRPFDISNWQFWHRLRN